MSRMEVKINYRRISSIFNPQTQSDIIRTDKGFDGTTTMDVHPLQTILDLKKKISNKLGFNLNKINIEKNGIYYNDNTRLNTIDFFDGKDLTASLSSFPIKHTNIDHDMKDNDFTTNTGSLIANNESRFNILLSLCEKMDTDISKKIWDLLMLIPTQIDILRFVEEINFQSQVLSIYTTNNIKDSKQGWNSLLGHDTQNNSNYKITYILQIIDHNLQPASELRTEDNIEHAKKFQNAFIVSGGFSAVLKVCIYMCAYIYV